MIGIQGLIITIRAGIPRGSSTKSPVIVLQVIDPVIMFIEILDTSTGLTIEDIIIPKNLSGILIITEITKDIRHTIPSFSAFRCAEFGLLDPNPGGHTAAVRAVRRGPLDLLKI